MKRAFDNDRRIADAARNYVKAVREDQFVKDRIAAGVGYRVEGGEVVPLFWADRALEALIREVDRKVAG